MKKKLLITMLALTATATCALSFTACNTDGNKCKHRYTETMTVPPTCTEQGYTSHTCRECGENYKYDYTSAKGHSYSENVVAPTCTTQGYTLHTCQNCGDNYKDGYADIAPTNHNYLDYTCTYCEEIDPAAPETEELEYTLNGDNTYSVVGISTSDVKFIKIPSSHNGKKVTSIGSWAFSLCTSLKSVVIPDCITSIGAGAFDRCRSLKNVTIPYSVTSINASTFSECWSLTSITIPYSVTSIGDSAFSNCALTSITIPDSVTSISYLAFFGCKFTSITIPNSVTSIAWNTFSCCYSIESITVAKTNSNYKSINNCILSKDGTELVFGCKNSIIPDGVTAIGNYAFDGCTSLTSLTIPNSVTSIGEGAFTYCTSLTSINFKSTTEEWNAIEKGNNWNSDAGNYTIHCTDGEIAKDGTVTMY